MRRGTRRRVLFTIVQGAGGFALYLNDLRIAGAKPLADGKVVQEWLADSRDVREAMGRAAPLGGGAP